MLRDIIELSFKIDDLERFLYEVFKQVSFVKKESDLIVGVGFLLTPDKYNCYVFDKKKNEFKKSILDTKSIVKDWYKKLYKNNTIVIFSNLYLENDEIYDTLASLINKYRLIDLLKSLILKDSLTNLYTRNVGEHLIKEKPLTNSVIILCDIDNFKQINDKYGHKYGDEILQKVGNFLSKFFRKDDIVVRWGGEEFLIFLSDIKTETDFKAVLYKIKETEKTELDVTLSYGAVYVENENYSYDYLFKLADYLLYIAKGKKIEENNYYGIPSDLVDYINNSTTSVKNRIIAKYLHKIFVVSLKNKKE